MATKQSQGFGRFLKNNAKGDSKTSRILRRSWLSGVTPHKGYSFYSDYFTIDSKTFATILTVFSRAGADDDLPPMWGISMIPFHLTSKDVSTHLINQVERADSKWVEEHQSKADMVASSQASESVRTEKRSSMFTSGKRQEGMDEIAREIGSGDSYLHVAFKILIKAPSLEKLDEGVKALTRHYNSRFATVYVEPFHGQQYDEFSKLLQSPQNQTGKNYGFTSTEFGGEYNLVTHGIADSSGKYMGELFGDVNSSAVLWDIDKFNHHVVVASDNDAETMTESFDHVRASTMWGTKIAQEALLNNHRVVNLVMNDATLNLGIDLSDITVNVSMNNGEINPFEVFGSVDNELQAFSMLTNKIRLMTKQLNPEVTPNALETLSQQLQKFYIKEGLWVDDAQNNQRNIRLIGLPHSQYPLMQKFTSYLKSARRDNRGSLDAAEAEETRLLYNIFTRMVTENGDLFNRITSDILNKINKALMVNYDLSSMMIRDKGIAMAQFVNVLSYSTSSLERGDVLIIHGTELIDPSVWEYARSVLNMVQRRDVRVVYLYDEIEKALEKKTLADLSRADWTLFGKMTNPDVNMFETVMGEHLPSNLSKSIVTTDNRVYYLRRNTDNVVFVDDVVLSDQ